MTITTATVPEAEEAQRRAEAALKKKDEGNAAFKEARYNAAVVHYTASLRLAPSHLVFGNRAQAYIHLAQYELALRDLNAALAIEPTFAKNANRRSKVLSTLGLHSAALADNAVVRRASPRDKAAQAEEETLRGKVNARYVEVKQWNSGEEFEEDEMIAIPIEGIEKFNRPKSPEDLPDIVNEQAPAAKSEDTVAPEEEKETAAADASAAPSADTTLDEETAAAAPEEEEAPAASKEDTVAEEKHTATEGTVSEKDEEKEEEVTVAGTVDQQLDSTWSSEEEPVLKYSDEEDNPMEFKLPSTTDEEPEEPEDPEEPQEATVPYKNTVAPPPQVTVGRETTVGDMLSLLDDLVAPSSGDERDTVAVDEEEAPAAKKEDTVADEAAVALPERDADEELPPASPAKSSATSSSLSSHTAEAPSDRTNSTASWEHVKNDTFESDFSDTIPMADGFASDTHVIPATPNESSDSDDDDDEVTGEEPKEEDDEEETVSVTSNESDDEREVMGVEKKMEEREEEESDDASVTPNDSGDEKDEKTEVDKEEKNEESEEALLTSPSESVDDDDVEEKEARGVEKKMKEEEKSDEASLTSANVTVDEGDEEEKEEVDAKEEQKHEKTEEVPSGVTAVAPEQLQATVAKGGEADTVVKKEEDTVPEKKEEEEEERVTTPMPTTAKEQEKEATVPAKKPTVIPAPATNLFDFCAHFAQLKHDPSAFGKYFLSLSPSSLHPLFLNLLEFDHLMAVVDGLTAVAKEDVPPSPALISSALLAVSKLPRFDILVMFMSDENRDKALSLIDSLPPTVVTRQIRKNFSQ